MKRLSDNQNHQNRLLTAISGWWQQVGIGTDLSRILVLILLALGAGFIFDTIFLWPKQYPSSSNQPHTEINRITVKRAYQLVQRQQAVIVDARDPKPYARNHIAGAVNLPLTQFNNYYPDFASQVEKSQTVILYCAAGCSMKEKVTTLLHERGYQHVHVMTEGPGAWIAAGYPVFNADDTHPTEGERQ